jgi:assimilatory nitrate reductase catalytic subunit
MAIACSCHGLRDRDVVEAIQGGASSVEDVIESCRAGSRCGGCVPTIAALLDAEAALDAALGPVVSSSAA